MIDDDKLKQRIRVAKPGSLSTVVWTPWTAKAGRMGDMGRLARDGMRGIGKYNWECRQESL
ncbi:MAG TPA: hypothetical protein VFQ94_01635 [Gallionella sp.]|nr:hypothetical protein [Gallionella sp.]